MIAPLCRAQRLLALLSHPCIVQCIGYTTQPAQLVLEVLDGTVYDLGRAMYNDSTPTVKLLDPLIDVLAGCAYLHARSPPLLHRDLKPPNVLHDSRHRCKLCDFGTTLELHPSSPPPTEWVGSPLYVAPEVDKQQPYGLPADVRHRPPKRDHLGDALRHTRTDGPCGSLSAVPSARTGLLVWCARV